MDLKVVTLAERHDLIDAFFDMPNDWAPFMLAGQWESYGFSRIGEVLDFQLAFLDGDAVVGRAITVPIRWDNGFDQLPARGLDACVKLCFEGIDQNVSPNVVVALEAAFIPNLQGAGLGSWAFEQIRIASRRAGFDDLIVPLRPTLKHLEPWTPFRDYVERQNQQGEPTDPWLRIHHRLGAEILHPAPVSQTIAGSLDDWHEWTGTRFTENGPTVVGQALSPVWVDVANDMAVYVEPNVWVHHRLTEP